MPKLRRLSGKEVIKILESFDFEIFSQKGSHIRLQRITSDGQQQRLLVALHGKKTIKITTLHSIYKTACQFIPEEDLKRHFYTD
ncbi:MAG: type II toxin-antitoxin system HicA family toxin [Chloroflexota bacterium]